MSPIAAGRRPFISVVVPVYNGAATLPACLRALTSSEFGDWELLAVDDGSGDESVAIARRFGATVLETGGRLGPAAARNLGAASAAGEHLLFLDADCAVHPETLAVAAADLRSDPGLDALFGSYDDEPAAATLVAQYMNLRHHFTHQRGEEDAATFWSGCGVIRRETFLRLGGFDSARYPRPSIEDIELGYRLRAAGGRIRLARRVQVKHLKAWRLGEALRSDLMNRGIPWTELMRRRRHFGRELNLSLASRSSVVAAVLLVVFLGLSPLTTTFLWGAALSAAALLALNSDFHLFLARKRGPAFMVLTVPLHWLYYLVCALSFVWGRLTRVPARDRETRPGAAATDGSPG